MVQNFEHIHTVMYVTVAQRAPPHRKPVNTVCVTVDCRRLHAKVQLGKPSPRSPAQERYLSHPETFCFTGDFRDTILDHMRTRRLGYFHGPHKGIPPRVSHLMIPQRCLCTPK